MAATRASIGVGSIVALVAVCSLAFHTACGSPIRSANNGTPSPFDGELRCPAGEKDGWVGWDYGIPRGTIEDPIDWVRQNAVGLDPALELSFVEEIRGPSDVFPNAVLATNKDGVVLAFVEFGQDENGRYFPNQALLCASTGIEEFT